MTIVMRVYHSNKTCQKCIDKTKILYTHITREGKEVLICRNCHKKLKN